MIKLIDRIVGALSLYISNQDDVVRYEVAYDQLRKTLMDSVEQQLGIPLEYEPIRLNRFVVQFPEDFQIPPWQVSSIELPQIRRNWWGKVRFGKMRITFFEIVATTIAGQFIHRNFNKKKFTITVQNLDPTGFVVHQSVMHVKRITGFSLGSYTTDSDQIAHVLAEFDVSNIIVDY